MKMFAGCSSSHYCCPEAGVTQLPVWHPFIELMKDVVCALIQTGNKKLQTTVFVLKSSLLHQNGRLLLQNLLIFPEHIHAASWQNPDMSKFFQEMSDLEKGKQGTWLGL